MDEWVYGCREPGRLTSTTISRKFGSSMLNSIKAKAYYSAPANYGAAFTSRWDHDGRESTMGLTLAEMEKIMEERGMLYE